MMCCPHTGVALAVLQKLVQRGEIQRHHRTVVISTAHGLKFTDFKVGYHQKTLQQIACHHANPPVYLPADASAVRDNIDQWLDGQARRPS
jgi:threonine synthase